VFNCLPISFFLAFTLVYPSFSISPYFSFHSLSVLLSLGLSLYLLIFFFSISFYRCHFGLPLFLFLCLHRFSLSFYPSLFEIYACTQFCLLSILLLFYLCRCLNLIKTITFISWFNFYLKIKKKLNFQFFIKVWTINKSCHLRWGNFNDASWTKNSFFCKVWFFQSVKDETYKSWFITDATRLIKFSLKSVSS